MSGVTVKDFSPQGGDLAAVSGALLCVYPRLGQYCKAVSGLLRYADWSSVSGQGSGSCPATRYRFAV